ncbi:SLIT and NTRK-like protein 6 [Protopterus annectens]|uniref:SLIT and NTRK-like protein 6 n=1 Tax=Protopterus annectens TaxID=7888 RepID=UPI001CF94BC0|nr:SLIT and NTRK-like protein 6 [Protopterus annectens]
MVFWVFLCLMIIATDSQQVYPPKSLRGSCDSLCTCETKDGVLSINCDYRGIKKISQIKVPANQLFHITLIGNEVEQLKSGDFIDFKNALSVHLGSNKIFDIEPGAFGGFSSIKQLHINQNYLEILKEDVFHGLENLEFLQADNNFIHTIEPSAFSKLKRLKVLILNDNAIENLPTNIFRFVPLTHLDLRGNQLQRLPYVGFLEHIGRIMELQLEDNKWVCDCDLLPLKTWLESMPPQFVIGDIVCNSPSELYGSILSKLKKEVFCPYDMEKKFRETEKLIPTKVIEEAKDPGIVPHATYSNSPGDSKVYPVTFLPEYPDILCPMPCHCTNHPLSGLLIHCQEKNIKSVSELQQPPPKPKKLLLNGNIIQTLTKSDLVEYGSLELLHLGNNRISSIQDGSFAVLNNLQKLYLNGNYLTRLSKNMFLGLHSLEYLYLEFNIIKEVMSGTFSAMPKLKVLYMSNNLLQTLPPHIFLGIPLARLNLKSNRFLHIAVSNVLDQLNSVVQLDLEDNPWDCTCDLVGLKQWVEKLSKKIHVGEVMCESPSGFAKKDLKSLKSDSLCPGLLNIPTQPGAVAVSPSATTTSTAATFIGSITENVPLSVLILAMLVVFIMIVFCAAGMIVFVLHRRRRSKKKQEVQQIKDSSPVHLHYSMYGHKTTHHTGESPSASMYEQRMITPIVHVYKSQTYGPKDIDNDEEEKDINDPKNLCRSLLERENESPLTGSAVKFRGIDHASEFIPLRDANSLYRNILERERELKQLGITEYLRKNIQQLQPDMDISYPGRHEELKLMETIMYARPRKVLLEQTKNEYFELKANLQTEPDYLEVLEQQV